MFLQLSAIFSNISAQEKFIQYSVIDGLSSNAVYSIEMDHEGYLWVGTYHGLNRFDGREFKQYYFGELASRKTDMVTDIHLDKKNRLWVSTRGGLYLYDRVEDIFNKINQGILKIGEIGEDTSGIIWAVGYGAFILDDSTLTLTEVEIVNCENRMIEDILFDQYGYIWLGWYWGGLTRCTFNQDSNSGKLHIDQAFSTTNVPIMKSDVIRELLIDKQGRLVFTSYHGLYWIDLNEGGEELTVQGFSGELEDARYWSVIQDQQGTIWAGSYGDGLFKLNGDLLNPIMQSLTTNLNSPASISCNEIYSIFEDKNMNIWIATENGLNRIIKNEIPHTTYQNIPGDPNSIASNHVFGIYQDSSAQIWCGTPKGISVFDYQENLGVFTNLRLKGIEGEDNFVYSVFPTGQKNQFYVGTLGGLYEFEPGGTASKIEGITHRVRSKIRVQDILRTSSLLWVATDDGLYSFDNQLNRVVSFFDFGQEPLDCRKILYSRDGSLWLATDNGLISIINPEAGNEENNIRNYPLRIESGNKFNNDVTDIKEDAALNKWIGTGSGLYFYNLDTREFVEFNSRNGLLEDYVAGIQLLEDMVVVVGISSIALINKSDNTVESYSFGSVISNYKDPLYSAVLMDDQIAVGGVNGLKVFNPKEFRKETTHFPLKIQDFRLGNESVKPAINRKMDKFQRIEVVKKIYLDSKTNTFRLDFSSLNLTLADKFSYKYKLDGYDENWLFVNSDQGFAHYSKLKSGKYLFRVNATNSLGQWNIKDTSLEIIVLSPIWLRWYFLLLYTAILVFLMILIRNELAIRYRLSSEKKLSREIQKKNEEQMKFFINISHELKTPLTMLHGPLDYLNSHLDRENELHKYAEWALNNTHRLTSIVNEILDFRLLEADKLEPSLTSIDWISFIEETFALFSHAANLKGISYILNNEFNSTITVDRSMIEKAIVSLLDNAFKYTPEGGQILLHAEPHKGSDSEGKLGVHITCSNTGSFIPAEELEKIFERFYRSGDNGEEGTGIGLSVTKQFIELHEGKVWCESSKESGVEMHIQIPWIEAGPPEQDLRYSTPEEYDRIYGAGPVEFNKQSTQAELSEEKTRKSILIVEDNHDLRNFMASALNNQFEVRLASNGKEAMTMINGDVHPELIVSDIMMPLMNGLELCQAIKEDVSTSHIPVILLTAQTERYSQLDGYSHMANAYLEKPFNMELFNACISSILKHKDVLRKYYSSFLFDSHKMEEDDPNAGFIDQLKQIILDHLDNTELDIDMLCELMSISQYMLYNKIKSITGKTPGQIIRKIRIKKAETLMASKQYSIKEVQYMTGFSNAKSFRDAFREEFGLLPSDYLA